MAATGMTYGIFFSVILDHVDFRYAYTLEDICTLVDEYINMDIFVKARDSIREEFDDLYLLRCDHTNSVEWDDKKSLIHDILQYMFLGI